MTVSLVKILVFLFMICIIDFAMVTIILFSFTIYMFVIHMLYMFGLQFIWYMFGGTLVSTVASQKEVSGSILG